MRTKKKNPGQPGGADTMGPILVLWFSHIYSNFVQIYSQMPWTTKPQHANLGENIIVKKFNYSN